MNPISWCDNVNMCGDIHPRRRWWPSATLRRHVTRPCITTRQQPLHVASYSFNPTRCAVFRNGFNFSWLSHEITTQPQSVYFSAVTVPVVRIWVCPTPLREGKTNMLMCSVVRLLGGFLKHMHGKFGCVDREITAGQVPEAMRHFQRLPCFSWRSGRHRLLSCHSNQNPFGAKQGGQTCKWYSPVNPYLFDHMSLSA